MTYIITDACIGTKDASCVDVCPVDCIHPRTDEDEFESAEMLYIDPIECIDCGACEPACPVEAIYPDFDLPDDKAEWLQVNADYFKSE
ncbi:MAG: ferredoxin family protein [Chloroflexota bacterium]|nr:ferredoxin family protein [Chloroflexota bacterium]MDE2863372.1 ferredoxin family protein [Chloroflexota bacterium]MDE2935716.1 ferredoxin family protein [Chloroflexota bacterium]MXW27365.1 ferredoxin family protein [Chloroflexota bacterium]MYB16771.1 ferredoxin family protein [Chloroflexota bacterium]